MMINKTKIFNKERGFTFIEIIVTMGIIAFLSATIFKVFNASDTQQGLIINADKLKAGLRLAQSYSLSNPQEATQRHLCGFGIYTPGDNSFILYYLYNSDYINNPYACSSLSLKYNPPNPLVKVDKNSVDLEDGFTVSCPDIFFKSPYREVYSGGAELGAGVNVVCTVTRTSDGSIKTVVVNSGGKISF